MDSVTKKLVNVEGGQFVKNTNNKALLAINESILLQNENRKRMSEKISSKNNDINILKDQVEEMSGELSEIKDMLKKLLNKKD